MLMDKPSIGLYLKQMQDVVLAQNEAPIFQVGDKVAIDVRFPIGHYRVPLYVRGKSGTVTKIIERTAVNNEEEAFGRNAGSKLHYYRLSIPMQDLWPDYRGSLSDSLNIEIFETWLRKA